MNDTSDSSNVNKNHEYCAEANGSVASPAASTAPPTKHEIERAKACPIIPPPNLDLIPTVLRNLDRWIAWTWDWSYGRKTWAKVPIWTWVDRAAKVVRHMRIDAHDPITHMPSDYAFGWAHAFNKFANFRGLYGLGFDLVGGDGVVCVDLDDCRNRDTGEITPRALKIVTALDSYTEVSPSGTGLKIYLLGKKPTDRCKAKYDGGEVEIYEKRRFVAVTGEHVLTTPVDLRPRQEQLDELCRLVFPLESEKNRRVRPQSAPDRRDANAPSPPPHPGAPSPPSQPLDLPDEELLDRIRRSTNGPKFVTLFDRGDLSAYDGDHSRADLALCSTLAWWCQGDAARIDRLFRRSALYRKKWDRADYRDRTIGIAVSGCTSFYTPGGRPAGSESATDPNSDTAPHQYLDLTDLGGGIVDLTEMARERREQEAARQRAKEEEEKKRAARAEADFDRAGELARAIHAAVRPPPQTIDPADIDEMFDDIHPGRRARGCGTVFEFAHKEKPRTIHMSVKCTRWRCGVCVECLKREWCDHLTPIVAACPKLWCWMGPAAAWSSIAKSITAEGKERGLWEVYGTRTVRDKTTGEDIIDQETGEVKTVEVGSVGYYRYWQHGDNIFVTAEVPFKVPKKYGGEVVELDGTLAEVVTRFVVESIPQSRQRPLSASRKWQLEREPTSGDWNRVRVVGHLPRRQHEEILRAYRVMFAGWDDWDDQPWRISWVLDIEFPDDMTPECLLAMYDELAGNAPPQREAG